MNSLKKIFISIKSQVDQVANDFENHEALAEAAIQDLQTLGSKTRLHLHRVSKMSAHYQKQLEQQLKQAQLWSERALKAKKEDQQKALQCVKRLRQTQQQITLLEQQYQESCQQEAKIRDDLNRISEQLQVLKNKKEILAARQNRASVQESLNTKNCNPILEVNHIFERWEGSVVSSEFEAPDLDSESDPLVQEFETSTSEHSDYPPSTDNTQINNKSLTQKITTYLRWIGSALIILSAISFMLQGYDEILPAYRYWVGLGLTLLLCGGGLICAYIFHETKGARIFFGLGAAFLPVQITQVSAMIYGYWHGQQAMQPEYSWLQFMDISPTIIALDLAITGLLLFLVSYASFSILARKHLKTLLIASAIANIILMLPIRDSSLVPLMIAGLFIYLRHIEQYLHNDRSMRLKEGLAARALISLPLLNIIGRSLLHPISWILALVVSAMIVVHCIYDIKRYTRSTNIIYLNQWLGTFAAIAGWLSVLSQFALYMTKNQFLANPLLLKGLGLSGRNNELNFLINFLD